MTFRVQTAHCLRPLPAGEVSKPSYEKRQPEKTLLYRTLQNHVTTFFAKCEASERAIPSFVKKEFEAFLKCGILAHGFARIYCGECCFDRLVAFSCKGRGFCGSCMARRMSETAWHMAESVIPEIPTRQWVLSVPPPLRFLMATQKGQGTNTRCYDPSSRSCYICATVWLCLKP